MIAVGRTSRLLAALAAFGLSVGGLAGWQQQAIAVEPTASLVTGQALLAGDELVSANGDYDLVMQADCNLVIYGSLGTPVWSTATHGGDGCALVNQADGNLVLYSAGGRALWASGRSAASATSLVMQDDGNLVQYTTSGSALWVRGEMTPPIDESTLRVGQALHQGDSLTSGSGAYTFIMQGDGNAVVYGPSGPLWSSRTDGLGEFLRLQDDGNLVVYSQFGTPSWAAGATVPAGVSLVMQNDGNLVLYAADGRAVWSSRTSPTRPPKPPITGSTMRAGDVLYTGDKLWSSNLQYALTMSTSGSAFVVNPSLVIWSSSSIGGTTLAMQGDGNVVVYNSAGVAVFSTATAGHPGAVLVMQDDGNLVVYAESTALWASKSSPLKTCMRNSVC